VLQEDACSRSIEAAVRPFRQEIKFIKTTVSMITAKALAFYILVSSKLTKVEVTLLPATDENKS
jgi:hypothetical protein